MMFVNHLQWFSAQWTTSSRTICVTNTSMTVFLAQKSFERWTTVAVVDSGCLRGRGEKIKKGTSCISPKEGQPPEHLSNTFVCFLSRGGTLGQPSRIVCNLSNHVFKLSTFNFFSFMKNCEYLQLKDYPLYDVSHHSLHKICLQHSFFLVNNESKWREKAFSCQKNKLSIHQQWNNRALTLQNALLSSCKHHCFCVCVCVCEFCGPCERTNGHS